ncbi:secretory phospholipase A2 receptor-like [Oryzias latipes]|uniref:C-type lectin domain-containing protein n=1 Tax=Oryzias latipes TaxID=8090 RepID=A0A3B3HYB9_ORYLA|nr:secretory phospholipase A2 receptor-like [Oryzias latipes]
MRNTCIFSFLLHVLPAICGNLLRLRPANFTQYDIFATWAEAEAICQGSNTEMVTIYDESENDFFKRGGGWIGLYRDSISDPWKWSEGNQVEIYSNWRDHGHGHENCGLKYRNEDTWRTDDCTKENLFMCYERLILVKENKTWEEALEHCRSLGDKVPADWNSWYDLATLMTEDDITYALQKAKPASSNDVWIGLRFLGHAWFWAGGEEVQNQDVPSCPAFRCGSLEKNSRAFKIRDCSERRNFFCYRRPKSI